MPADPVQAEALILGRQRLITELPG
jgi:hypothetical protein